MKSFRILLVVFLSLPLLAMAQDTEIELFSIPLSSPGSPGKLTVEQLNGSINVEAYEGSEVVVKATFGNRKAHYKEKKQDKSGLRRIDHSSLDISGEEKNNEVKIINEQWNKVTNLEIKVPKDFSLKLGTVNQGNILVKGVSGEMEISNVNGEITCEEVGGSVSADTVNGDIIVSFVNITQGANMAFSSLNGDLDITFPSSLKANVKAKSDMGEIYTDFDMAIAKQEPNVEKSTSSGVYKVKVEQWVRGTINGGGPEMLFKSFNGNIMIKSK
ncbi:DUF4097 family beta strand repeat-containing protein [Poritiphilus flavus]|uniref:DUF4097 family beta strand repeat protein n=1 Tax=Poritiphilus flavus TaxID=2697053 RepID=A0A6L9E6R3_9FLAO|nr:DUF4097 family beta strand repeat-containing protein [Poritiphilus flavus]NAS10386.1 DUF4097 family beta strand repeat protein [Poritiphilus flavus]